MAKFVVELTYRCNDADDRARLEEVRPKHRNYCDSLAKREVLLAGGPLADGTGGLLVYEAADHDELREILDGDPYFGEDVIESTRIKEWNVVIGHWLNR